MRILVALLLIGLAPAAEAKSASPDLAKKVMTEGEIIAHHTNIEEYTTHFHIRYKREVYICKVRSNFVVTVQTGCRKITFEDK